MGKVQADFVRNVTGGEAGINESHFIGTVYGMERMMGRAKSD